MEELKRKLVNGLNHLNTTDQERIQKLYTFTNSQEGLNNQEALKNKLKKKHKKRKDINESYERPKEKTSEKREELINNLGQKIEYPEEELFSDLPMWARAHVYQLILEPPRGSRPRRRHWTNLR